MAKGVRGGKTVGSYRRGTHQHAKGYPRVSAGPLRDQYVHRIVAAALLGRELKKDEEVHHRDGDRTNFHWTNLLVLGNRDHGWVSSRQAWFMRERHERERREWEAFLDEQAAQQRRAIAEAKAMGNTIEVVDGALARAWEARA